MEYTFFWHGPFSQWHPSKFTIDHIEYNCAEQFMMACKAKRFNDNNTLEKIMKAKTPKEQKTLGRQVENFNPEDWDRCCKLFVYEGNLAKFSQNDDLKEELRATIGTFMVEASPYDKVWGIGIGPDDELRLDPKNWQGTNYLGLVLNQVRKDMFNANEDIKIDGL